MSDATIPNRCRLVLVAFPDSDASAAAAKIKDAVAGGDVASVILAPGGASEKDFQTFCELAVPVIQSANAAAMVVDSSQIAGRAKADGVHVLGDASDLKQAVDKLSPRLIVGSAASNSRHDALEKGEQRPDYVFFGKFDGDTHPDAHPKNLEFGEWWASMIEIPCIVMGGYLPESVGEIARTGAEFAALSAAVFGEGRVPREQVARANLFLDAVGEFQGADHAG